MSLIPYDDRDGQIWLNGKMIPWRDAKTHVLTHSLHYGGAVFEGARAYGGTIFKLTEHSQRLIDSARIVDMKMLYSVEQIDAACNQVLKTAGYSDAYIRPFAWRGAEQMGVTAQQAKVNVCVAVWQWPSYFGPEILKAGISLNWSKWRRPAPDTAPVHAKASGLYMICTMSKHDAERAGYTDALMLDYRGRVAEATGANFFIVKNGELHTPVPDCFLNGITRQTVIALAREHGIKVVERVIMPEELKDADECFVTGTAAEVTPVGKIADMTYKVGPISLKLREAYLKLAGASDENSARKLG